MIQSNKIKIAVFASGGGSNAREIFAYFKNHHSIEVQLCIYNNKNAGVVNHCHEFGIQAIHVPNSDFETGEEVLQILRTHAIDYIILAGFLRKIAPKLIANYPEHIINIHPALLPKYGGKGMYGMNVHNAVKENNEEISGPTIHLVNSQYDEGAVIAQFETKLNPEDSAETIQKKVLKLEHKYFSQVIENYILKRK